MILQFVTYANLKHFFGIGAEPGDVFQVNSRQRPVNRPPSLSSCGSQARKRRCSSRLYGEDAIRPFLLRQVRKAMFDGFQKTFWFFEFRFTFKTSFPPQVFFTCCGEALYFSLAHHLVEVVHFEGCTILHCRVHVGNPFAPPSAAPWFAFTVEWRAPATSCEVRR